MADATANSQGSDNGTPEALPPSFTPSRPPVRRQAPQQPARQSGQADNGAPKQRSVTSSGGSTPQRQPVTSKPRAGGAAAQGQATPRKADGAATPRKAEAAPQRAVQSRTAASAPGVPEAEQRQERGSHGGATVQRRSVQGTASGSPARGSAGSAGRQAGQPGRVTSDPAGVGQQRAAAGSGARPPVTASDPSRHDPSPAPRRSSARVRRRRTIAVALVVLLLVGIGWPIGLLVWANGKLTRIPALSGAADTTGTTYLIAGSDARGELVPEDGTEGQRTDSILVLHKPASGPVAMISIPRDTYVTIPGYGGNKINAAYAFGGAPLLVETVEGLTGMTVDHFVKIGMDGVAEVVDAVGGVELCYDRDVNDADSGMVWTAGCHVVDGTQALSFTRMRKADPLGDIGRAERQRQVIAATMNKVKDPSLLLKPSGQISLINAGTSAVVVDDQMGALDLARLALAFRAATGEGGITGTPPIKSLDYRPGGVGSSVLLDPDQTPAFFDAIANGTWPAGVTGGVG